MEREKLRLDTRKSNEELRPDARSGFEINKTILDAISNQNTGDKFYFDDNLRPIDFVYQWKRFSYGGKEDREHQAALKRLGWSPVPRERHPEIGNESDNSNIIIGGLILMERHKYYDEHARKMERQVSSQQLEGQFQRLKLDGSFDAPAHMKLNQSFVKGQDID
jgi:hypothetical protein